MMINPAPSFHCMTTAAMIIIVLTIILDTAIHTMSSTNTFVGGRRSFVGFAIGGATRGLAMTFKVA